MKLPEKLHYDGKNRSIKQLQNLLDNKEYLITDERTIVDSLSPTGKSYLGIAKNPLTKVKKGFGFYGVLLQTDNRQFVQCHVCGLWFRKITDNHLLKHRLGPNEYRKKFGLRKTTSLVPDSVSYEIENRTRLWLSKYLKNPSNKKRYLERLKKAHNRVSIVNKGNKYPNESSKTEEHKNQHNMCEKQLKFRLMEYIKKYKSIPTKSMKGEGSNICNALYARFGSRNLGLKHYKFPTMHKIGNNIELTSINKKYLRYNMLNYDRQKVYDWIVENSPLLKK